eukprot:2667943-Rhodomonas_salina.1
MDHADARPEQVQETKGTTEALSNLALAKFQTGDTAGSLTMCVLGSKWSMLASRPRGVSVGVAVASAARNGYELAVWSCATDTHCGLLLGGCGGVTFGWDVDASTR